MKRRRSWWDRLAGWVGRGRVGSVEPEGGLRLNPRDPEGSRRRLAEEQRRLSDELEGVFHAYEERLTGLALRLRTLEPGELVNEMAVIRDAQERLRQTLERLALADRDTRALTNEWRDWETLAHLTPERASEALRRCELLRSELAVRGVEVGESRVKRSVEIGAPEKTEDTMGTMAEAIVQMQEDEQNRGLEEWDGIARASLPQALAYLEREVGSMWSAGKGRGADSVAAANLVRAFRHAHATQRLLDRKDGKRRYRVGVFVGE